MSGAERRFDRAEAEEQPAAEEELNDRIYFLLIKNVSRDSPLTPDEIEVIKHCLSFLLYRLLLNLKLFTMYRS